MSDISTEFSRWESSLAPTYVGTDGWRFIPAQYKGACTPCTMSRACLGDDFLLTSPPSRDASAVYPYTGH